MAVINQFSSLQMSNLHWLNSANNALIPKKEGAEEITGFRPISLIRQAYLQDDGYTACPAYEQACL
jgi:hypothetical protein